MKLRLEIVTILFLIHVFLISCSQDGSRLRHSPKISFLTKDSIYLTHFVMALHGKKYLPFSVKSHYKVNNSDTLDLLKGKTDDPQSYVDSVNVPLGAMYETIIPGSTIVSLNAGTKLSFKDSTFKELKITGEGFFETDKTGSNLTIKADSIIIEVAVGSSVNVFNFANEKDILISLLNGNIAVKNGRNSETCNTPGTLIHYNRQTMQFTKQICEIEQIAAWREGRFYFPHIGLYSLLHYMGRWYNKEIIFSDSLPEGDFHISLWNYMNLKDVIEVLEHTCDIRCELGTQSTDRSLRIRHS